MSTLLILRYVRLGNQYRLLAGTHKTLQISAEMILGGCRILSALPDHHHGGTGTRFGGNIDKAAIL